LDSIKETQTTVIYAINVLPKFIKGALMKTREELQQIYTNLASQLGDLEYNYLVAKHQILTKVDEVQKEFAELSKLPEVPKE
jgi:hypothetical protein